MSRRNYLLILVLSLVVTVLSAGACAGFLGARIGG